MSSNTEPRLRHCELCGESLVQRDENSVAIDRAVWLAKVAQALNEATTVVAMISNGDSRIEILQVYAAIEALKVEVDSMRLRRAPRPLPSFDPNWMNLWSEPVVRTV